jgi:hypothetical protein
LPAIVGSSVVKPVALPPGRNADPLHPVRLLRARR